MKKIFFVFLATISFAESLEQMYLDTNEYIKKNSNVNIDFEGQFNQIKRKPKSLKSTRTSISERYYSQRENTLDSKDYNSVSDDIKNHSTSFKELDFLQEAFIKREQKNLSTILNENYNENNKKKIDEFKKTELLPDYTYISQLKEKYNENVFDVSIDNIYKDSFDKYKSNSYNTYNENASLAKDVSHEKKEDNRKIAKESHVESLILLNRKKKEDHEKTKIFLDDKDKIIIKKYDGNLDATDVLEFIE